MLASQLNIYKIFINHIVFAINMVGVLYSIWKNVFDISILLLPVRVVAQGGPDILAFDVFELKG